MPTSIARATQIALGEFVGPFSWKAGARSWVAMGARSDAVHVRGDASGLADVDLTASTARNWSRTVFRQRGGWDAELCSSTWSMAWGLVLSLHCE